MPEQHLKDRANGRLGDLEKEYSSFRVHHKELSQYFVPRRGRFEKSDRNRGEKRHQAIINSRGTKALRVAAAGTFSGVMSPSRPWFEIGPDGDPDLWEFTPVRVWTAQVREVLLRIFNASNLYNMAPSMLLELWLFATGCMTQVDDFDDVTRFYTQTAGSYFIGQDSTQRVNTLARCYDMTVFQIVERFGLENVSTAVRQHWDKSNYDSWYPVVNLVEPNVEFQPRRLRSRFKKFASLWWEPGSDKDKWLKRSGFDQFPAYVPRWGRTGWDVYGTDCPGMDALGDVKGMQIKEKRKAQAIDKISNPPLKGPATLRNVPVSSLPGGLTLFTSNSDRDDLKPIYQVNPDVSALMADLQNDERRIQDIFFNDMFLAISNMEGIQPRNQLEIAERNQERLLQLGPVLEQLEGDFLDPLIERTFDRANAIGLIPEPPPELNEVPLKIRYISSLAMAQRAVATGDIERLVLFLGQLGASGFVDAIDKFDADQAIDEYAKVTGVPPRVIRSDDAVQDIRQQRAQAQQLQQALEMAKTGASAAKDASQATDSSGANIVELAAGQQ